MRFSVLGTLDVRNADIELMLTTPKLRQALALLLVRHNQMVGIGELITELWGEDPPARALATLQTYVYKLRKLIEEANGDTAGKLLLTKPSGYLLDVSGCILDLREFATRAEKGRELFEAGDNEQARRVLAEGLALWRGAPLSDVAKGELLTAEATRLEEWRLQALQTRIEADLALGRHRELVSELREFTRQNPLHESFQAHLMLALHRSGRRVEALQVYQQLRGQLVRELGLEPSPELVRLHQALLASDPSLDRPATRQVAVTTESAATFTAPAQLPPDVADFTGRRDQLAWIERELASPTATGTSTRVICVGGPPGIGKSTLAVHAAHRIGAAFPDGQLFANLRGTGPRPADPAEVLAGFLRALGEPVDRIPDSLDERSTLFRTLAGRRGLLIVLDDAVSAEQVTPLLPGSRQCAVLVTGRLLGIPGAASLLLEPLTEDEGVRLLANVTGQRRVAADRAAAAQIVRMVGGLPLALRAVGVRLVSAEYWPLRKIVDQLADPQRRLDILRYGDLDVRASYDRSVSRLEEPAKIALVLLGLLAAGPFVAAEAAKMFGSDEPAAEALLTRLVEDHLLRMAGSAADPEPRYELSEVTRWYARDQLQAALGTTPAGLLDEEEGVPSVRGPHGHTLVLLEPGDGGVVHARQVRMLGRPDGAEAPSG